MEELLKKLAETQAALGKSVANLQESITARFSSADPNAAEAEKDGLVNQVKELQEQVKAIQKVKAIRKMVWGTPNTKADEGTEVIGFSRFLKAVSRKDDNFLAEMKAPTGQSEGVMADGGYVVPIEYSNEIIKLERQSSIARSLARVFPMGSETRKIPRELARPTVYWVGEGTEIPKTKGTLEQLTQTAKKMAAIVAFTQELLEDNNVSYDQFIAESVATEMGREEDKLAFVGDATDPFIGVYFASGVNSVSLAGADPAYVDLVSLMMSLKAPYRTRGSFVLSSTALVKVMKMVDDQNRPIWGMPEGGNPGRILGKTYQETDQIPDTLGTERDNGTNTAVLFGAWDGLWISPRGSYSVTSSDSASDSAGKSAFTLDEVWFKFRRRESIQVVNPEALARLVVPAA